MAALLRATTARVVDDQPTHRAGGVAEKARAIGVLDIGAPDHVEVSLVKEGRRPDRQRRSQTTQAAFRHAVQLGVQHAEQCIGCRRIRSVGPLD